MSNVASSVNTTPVANHTIERTRNVTITRNHLSLGRATDLRAGSTTTHYALDAGLRQARLGFEGLEENRSRLLATHFAQFAVPALDAGEVLVVPFTTPVYNVVLPIAGALVTAEGGPLSHAAVLAREL